MAKKSIIQSGPLTTGVLLISIIGFFVSAFFLYNLTPTWGFTFSVFCVILFFASMISLAKSDVDSKLREEIEASYPKGYRDHIKEKRQSLKGKK